MKINELKPEYVYYVPDKMEEGVLYISREFRLANHLCACGCGIETVTPLGKDDWQLTDSNGLVTLRPSIGNFRWENPYHAHYYITNNNIEWL
jgi:hypothetical protein